MNAPTVPNASITLDAPTLLSGECATIRTALARVRGVRVVLTDLMMNRVTIEYAPADLDVRGLVHTLHTCGLKRASAQAALSLGTDRRDAQEISR